MSQFAELLGKLAAVATEQDTMAKALPVEGGEDDKAIQAAAAEGAESQQPTGDNPEDEDEASDGGEQMTKSIMIDGEEHQVVDAEALIKSVTDLTGRLGDQEAVLAKALETTLGALQSQGQLIKSLQAKVDKLSGEGKGRKTVLTISEKPQAGEGTLAKSEQQDGLTPQQFMLKANAAFESGKLTGKELTVADVSLRSGQPIPAEIIAKALS